jgi:hypothetical protein
MLRIVTLLIGLFFFNSCDCVQRVAGTIIDKETGKPLQGVTVYNQNKEWVKTTTDTTGHFELSSISGGFRCPPMTINVKADNYKNAALKIPAGGYDTIQLVKQ